mmetsp:Transcript_48578/g.146511  ORF Transcript_48578/g.146511 Transcript_48578/m.146511 type:complete len:95 (+) Transcript_48578:956-1240(+)
MGANCTLSSLRLDGNPIHSANSGSYSRQSQRSAEILRQIQDLAEWNNDGPDKAAARKRYYGGIKPDASLGFETLLPSAAEQLVLNAEGTSGNID